MNEDRIMRQLSQELGLTPGKVKTTVALFDEGNTIPFIARYRKEMTGELDENQLRVLQERLGYLRNLEQRKEEVLRAIEEQGKLTEELSAAIGQASKLQEVEDLYRPYRPKRKTRASMARERGLEPLAEWLMGLPPAGDPQAEAARYIDEAKGVASAEEALQGAMDIIAEQLADDARVREWLRVQFRQRGNLVTEAKNETQESVYEMYYQYQEPVKRLPPHRILAINRGEREDVLRVSLELADADVAYIHSQLLSRLLQGTVGAGGGAGTAATGAAVSGTAGTGVGAGEARTGAARVSAATRPDHGQRQNASTVARPWLEQAAEDAYKRLLAPAVEREIRSELTEKAEEQAIRIFAENLRNLLLQPPIKGHTVLGVDPAFRTGCKLAVVDDTGKLLEVAVTYPTAPHHRTAEAKAVFNRLIEQYGVSIIVIGNGTASRETEQFVSEVIRESNRPALKYIIVSEAGASVYSASKLAQEEFPDLDVAERSAASIARRLQDPLAELVKIDPKSIGVGQYQHDVGQKRLEESLQAVVESAVNHVGVDLNTASAALLSYVSGVSAAIAKQIVKHREANGKFADRSALLKVPRLGAKTFEQCAGFLRIAEGREPLDNTPIHPESYDAVARLLAELQLDPRRLGSEEMKGALDRIAPEQLAPRLGVGVPTLRDILDSLRRPGRDPREELPPPIFHTDILKLEDLAPGMELKGTVRNVIDFGAFVDIGLKNDGLVHISQMSDRFVKHPTDVVAVGDTVTVWVLKVDVQKGRVSLTMRKP